MSGVARVQGTTNTALTAAATPAAQPRPQIAPLEIPSRRDHAHLTTLMGSAPATVALLGAPVQTASLTAPRPPVSLSSALPGFRPGQRVEVSATGLFGSGMVGGGGRMTAISADRIAMDLKIEAPFGAGGDLAIDLRFENGAYVLKSPEQWNARVTKNGNSVTVVNTDNGHQRITVRAVRSGQVQVDTRGMGFDGKTLVVTAR